MSISGSVVSYKDRGNYGKSSWIGNCSGRFIKDLLLQFRPKVYVDCFKGSDTSGDVVKELNGEGANIEYHGFDLHSGFNSVTDSIAEKIGGSRADYVFLHPPYSQMLQYSGVAWGTKPHAEDLSHCSYDEFLEKMRRVMQNAYDALSHNSRYSVLIGDVRKKGVYTSIQADLQMLAPGKLESIIIKMQHNCNSSSKNYSNNSFIPIQHEYCLTYVRDKVIIGFLDSTLAVSERLGKLAKANWKAVVKYALNKLGNRAHLNEIYAVISETSPELTKTRKNWRERVRATIYDNAKRNNSFRRVEEGVWAIA